MSEFKKYRATRSFHIGEIAKSRTGAQSDIRENEELEFNGEFCVFRGTQYKTPGLKGAIDLKWLIPSKSDYKPPKIPVVRDEVSRPLGSDEKELEVEYTGLTLEEYDFSAHWRTRQKLLFEVDSPDVLRDILEQETEKFKPHAEKRLAELEAEIAKSSHSKIGAIELSDDHKEMMKTLNEEAEVQELPRNELKSKSYQTPKGKKTRKPLQRDVMEQEEKVRPSAKPKGKKAKKDLKLRRDSELVEGDASAVREIKATKGRSRNRK